MRGSMVKGLLGPSILFAVLISLMVYWLAAFPQNQEFIFGFGTLIGSLLLVYVTIYYTLAAFSLVAETQKDREIAWTEHQLKDLYYPLMKGIEESKGDPGNFEALLDHEKMAYRVYLAEPALKNEIEHFMKTWKTERIDSISYKVRSVYDAIQKLVSRDIEQLESRLGELTRSKL